MERDLLKKMRSDNVHTPRIILVYKYIYIDVSSTFLFFFLFFISEFSSKVRKENESFVFHSFLSDFQKIVPSYFMQESFKNSMNLNTVKSAHVNMIITT